MEIRPSPAMGRSIAISGTVMYHRTKSMVSAWDGGVGDLLGARLFLSGRQEKTDESRPLSHICCDAFRLRCGRAGVYSSHRWMHRYQLGVRQGPWASDRGRAVLLVEEGGQDFMFVVGPEESVRRRKVPARSCTMGDDGQALSCDRQLCNLQTKLPHFEDNLWADKQRPTI